jgi:hypothetical protein
MARFNLNVVIEDIEEVEGKVKNAIAEFNKILQEAGHVVSKSTLTSDKGQVDVTPPPVEPVEETPVEEVSTETPARPHSTLDS